ncbi:hypothetical protein AUJ67_05080 [Candidatus Desantisbacteria bacterium CG1_02_49_89]|nr:MAG: hypothetical protein AUJ67_05080 [Candidatus Desantisbacteria bacterium CG1_02_49_89]
MGGQSFTPVGTTMKEVRLHLEKIGSPSESIVLYVYPDTPPTPGVLLGSDTLAPSEISGNAWYTFSFSPALNLTDTPPYYMEWKCAGGDASNKYLEYGSTSNPYPGGIHFQMRNPLAGNDAAFTTVDFHSYGGQSFITGPAVTNVSRIDIVIEKLGSPQDPLNVILYTDPPPSKGAALATATLPYSAIGSKGWYSFAFNLVPVNPSDTYYFEVDSPGGDYGNRYITYGATVNPYPQGMAFSMDSPQPANDIAFKTYYGVSLPRYTLTNDNLLYNTYTIRPLSDGGRQVEFLLKSDSPAMRAKLCYELGSGKFYTYKSVSLKNGGETPAPDFMYLDEVEPVHSQQDWGSLGISRSVEGNTLAVKGETFTRGLGTHANSEIIFDLASLKVSFKRFRCLVGKDSEVPNGTVRFYVVADGDTLYTSSVMDSAAAADTVDVSIAGKKWLKLKVTDAGDGIASDHADWLDARLVYDTFLPNSGVYVTQNSSDIVLGNNYLERTVDFSGGKVRTTSVKNKLTGENSVFSSNKEFGLTVEIGADTAWLMDAQVETFTISGGPLTAGGFGDPIYCGNLFLGLEYIAGYNNYSGSVIVLKHFPGRVMPKGFTQTKKAVIGVSAIGDAQNAFIDYIDENRPDTTPHCHISYCTWWTLPFDFSESECLDLMDVFKAKLFDPYGASFDSFLVDAGWSDKFSIWKINTGKFPLGFSRLKTKADAMNTRLGLWMSPSSCYPFALDNDWAEAQGYEAFSTGWMKMLCLAGPKYGAEFIKTDLSHINTYNMSLNKFDGFWPFAHDNSTHGHFSGDYGVEANIDRYVLNLRAIHYYKPDFWTEPTATWNKSPWWLQYSDSIIGNHVDDYPYGIVPALNYKDAYTTRRCAGYRDGCKMWPSLSPSGQEVLGVDVQTSEPWQNDAVTVVCRGSLLNSLYVNNNYLDSPGWGFLAQLMKWQRQNQDILFKTRLILGDPEDRWIYGYSHFAGGRGIIFVRNPFVEEKNISISFNSSIGFRQMTGNHFIKITYLYRYIYNNMFLYGDSIVFRIGAYEALVFEVFPETELVRPVIMGCRYDTATAATYNLYSEPGCTRAVKVIDPITPANNQDTLVYFPGNSATITVTSYSDSRANGFSGIAQINVPTTYSKPEFIILCSSSVAFNTPACAINVNGVPRAISVLNSDTGWASTGESSRLEHWYWFITRVNTGTNNVTFTVSAAPCDYSAWVHGTRKLAKVQLNTPVGNGSGRIDLNIVDAPDSKVETVMLIPVQTRSETLSYFTVSTSLVPADGLNNCTVAIYVKGGYGVPIEGAQVTIVTSRGSLYDTVVQPGLTDAYGQCEGLIRSPYTGDDSVVVICLGATITLNIAPNFSYEDGSGYNAADWAEGTNHNRYADRLHTGLYSLRSTFAETATSSYSGTILVARNSVYRLSGWIYNSLTQGQAYYDLGDAAGEPNLVSTNGANRWEYLEGSWPSAAYTSVQVRCVTDGSPRGTAWFDDVKLQRVPAISFVRPALRIMTPPFAVTQGNPSPGVIIEMQDEFGVKDATFNGTAALFSSLNSGVFSVDRINWINTTVITMSAGGAVFYYRNPNTGVFVITAYRTSLIADTQTEIIAAQGVNETASYITFIPYRVAANGFARCTAVVTINDTYGFPITNKLVTLQTTRGNSDTIRDSVGSTAGNTQTTDIRGKCTFTITSAFAGYDTIFAVCSGRTITRGVNKYGAAGIWNFDTDTLDVSGNGNICALYGPAWASAPDNASSGSALKFNGTGDYAEVSYSQSLNNTTAVTIELWAKSNTPNWNSYGMLVSKRDAYILHPWQGTKDLYFYVCVYGSEWVAAQYSSAKSLTQWHHYAGSYDGSAIRIYEDGVLMNTFSIQGTINPDVGGPVQIGRDDNGANRYFDGYIDEVRIYNRALSDTEIRMSFDKRANFYFYPVIAARLKITTPSFSIPPNCISPLITVEAQDNTGDLDINFNNTVTLSTSSGSGTFSVSNTNWVNTTVITLKNGLGSFYYRDNSVGSPVLTVTRYTLLADTQTENIQMSDWVWINNVSIESGAIHTSASGSWNRDGFRTKRDYLVPRDGLEVEYCFKAIKAGADSQMFESRIGGAEYHRFLFVVINSQYAQVYTKDVGDPNWVLRATSPGTITLGTWYYVKATIKRAGFKVLVKNRDTGDTFWNPSEYPIEPTSGIGFLLGDAEPNRGDAETWWDDVRVWSFQREFGPNEDDAGVWSLTGSASISGGQFHTYASGSWNHDGVQTKSDYFVPPNGIRLRYSFKPVTIGQDSQMLESRLAGARTWDFAFILNSGPCSLWTEQSGAWAQRVSGPALSAGTWYDVDALINTGSFQMLVYDSSTGALVWDSGYVWKDTTTLTGFLLGDCEPSAGAGQTDWDNIRILSTGYVIPEPKEARYCPFEGRGFIIDANTKIVLSSSASADDILAADLLRDDIQSYFGVTVPVTSGFDTGALANSILAGIPSQDGLFDQICKQKGIEADPGIGDEGYILEIVEDANFVIISARHSTGLFYGLVTLRQLLDKSGQNKTVTAAKIRDFPIVRYRGMSEDISRGQRPTVDYLKQMMDIFSYYKMNCFEPYIEVTFYFANHPDIGVGWGPLTAAEVQDISYYAKQRHVEFYPLFESLGHQANLLSLPAYNQYAEVPASPWSFAIANAGSYTLLDSLFGELCPAFNQSLFFFIGCDEAYDMGAGQSKELADQIGKDGIFIQHVNRLYDTLKGVYNETVILCMDAIIAHPQILTDSPTLPLDTIIMNWEYNCSDSLEDRTSYPNVDLIANSGRRQWMMPGISAWLRIFPNFRRGNKNIKSLTKYGMTKQNVDGMINTDWLDERDHMHGVGYYGRIFGAECAWSLDDIAKTYNESENYFGRRFSYQFFGSISDDLSNAIRQMSETDYVIHDLSTYGQAGQNASWNWWLFWDDPFWGNYSRDIPSPASKASAMLALADPALATFNSYRPSTRFNQDSLDTIINASDRVRYLAERIQDAEQIRSVYATACDYADDTSFADGVFNSINTIITNDLKAPVPGMKSAFENLWLSENIYPFLDSRQVLYDWLSGRYDHTLLRLKHNKERYLQKGLLDSEFFNLPETRDAQFLNNTIPDTMHAGCQYFAQVTVLNNGNLEWTDTEAYKLGAVGDADPFTFNRQFLSKDDIIWRNETKAFTVKMTAPETPGVYLTDWRMLEEGVAWFGGAFAKNVTVLDTQGPNYFCSYIKVNTPVLAANGASTTTVMAEIRSNTGFPVSGETLSLVLENPILRTVNPGSAVSDANGQATFTISSYYAGNEMISAVYNGVYAILENIVANPSFETGTGNDASGWAEGLNHIRSSDRSYSGNYSLRSTFIGSDTSTRISVAKIIPGSSYKLSGRIFNSFSSSGQAYFDMNDRPSPGSDCALYSTQGKSAWELLQGTWYSGSETTAILRCVTDGSPDGTAWFDAVRLERIPTMSFISTRLKITSFAQAIPANTASLPVSVEARGNSGGIDVIFNESITLLSSSATGRFSINGVSWQDTTNIYLSSGQGTFYYKDSNPGSPVITAYRLSLIADTQTITITGNPSYFVLSPPVVSAGGTSKCTVTVSVKSDTGGILTGRTVTLYSSRGNSDPVQPASQLTDVNGQATFTVSSIYAGDAAIKAACDSATISNTLLDYFSSSLNWAAKSGTWLIESNEYSGDAGADGVAETPFAFPGGTVYIRLKMMNGYGGITSSHMIFYKDPNNFFEWAIYNSDSTWIPDQYMIKQVAGGIPYVSIQPAGEEILYDKWYEVRIEVTQEKVRWWLNNRFIAEWARPVGGSAAVYSKLQLEAGSSHTHYDDLKIGAVNFSPAGTRLKITTPPFSVNQFKPSSQVTVEAQDSGGNKDLLFNNTAVLYSSSVNGKFSLNDDPWSDTTVIRFSSGAGVFFYKDLTVGSPVLTVTRYTLLADTQTETITAAVASSTLSYLVLNPPVVSTGAKCTVTVSVKSDVSAALSGKNVSLYTNRGNTDTIQAVQQITDSNGQATFTISSVSAGDAAVKAVCDTKTIGDTLIANFTGGASGWAALAGTWQVENNEYSGDMDGTGISETLLEFSGGTLYVRLKMANGYGGATAAHLIFYSSASNFLEWSVRNNDSTFGPNYFEIRQKTGGTVYSVTQQLGEAITYNKWYEVRIDVTQSKVRWWLNNSFIAEWARPAGSPAVYSKFRLKTEDSHVHFDDIKIDAVNFSASAAKLKITTPPFSSSQYAPSPSIAVEAQDNTGNKVLLFNNTVTLLSSSAQGKFSVNISPWSDTTNIYLSSGAGIFYYRDGNISNPRLTAYRLSLIADTQTETITAAVAGETASYITFYPYLVPADNSSRCTVVVTVNENYFGIPLSGKLVTLQTTRGNSDTIRDSVNGTVNPQTTSASGQCTFTVFSSYVGLDTITAFCGGKTIGRGTDKYGAVGIWHLDSNASDLSGNGNNGSLVGSPAWVSFPDAAFGSAMQLSGTGDYADCGNGSSLRIPGALTIEVWANLVPDPAWSKGWMMVAGKRYPYDDAPWALRQGGSAVYVVINPKGGSNYLTMQVEGVADRAWHHIVATYDGNYGRTYIDNTLRATSVQASFVIDTAPAEHFFIGGWQMQGTLDEVRLYNRALSADEISASYTGRANIYFTANRLKITTPARTTTVNNPTPEITIQAQDGVGNKDVTNNNTFGLQNSGTGYFSVDRFNWVNTTSVTLQSGEVTVYYKNPNTGSYIITAYRASFTGDTQIETVVAQGANANASYITFNPHQVPADNGTSVATAVVFIADTYGFPVAGKTVTLAASRGNSVTIQPTNQPTGSNGMCTFTIYSGYAGQDTVCAACGGNTIYENVMMATNNPSFELGAGISASGWNMAVNQFRDSARTHTGSFSIMCKTGGPSASITQASVPVQQNSNYLYSAWFWSQHNPGSCYIDLADVTDDPNLTCTPDLQTWEYRSIIWNSTTYTGVVQRVVTDGGFSGTCWVDDMMLRRSPTLTFTATKLDFVSPSFRIRAGDTSPQVTAAAAGNSGGADEIFNDTVSLSTNSSSGSFSVSDISWANTTVITFSSGVGSFYYRDFAVGSPVLTADHWPLATDTQTETVTIRFLRFANTIPFTITSVSTAPVFIKAGDGFGNTAVLYNDTVQLLTTSAKGSFSVSGTTWANTSIVYLSSGSKTVYYRDKSGGNPVTTVTRTDSWTWTDTQQETVTKPTVLTSKVQMNIRSGETGSMPMRFWQSDTVEYTIYIKNIGTETAINNIVVDTRSFDTSTCNLVNFVNMDSITVSETWAYTTDTAFLTWIAGSPASGASNVKGLRWRVGSLGINETKAIRFRVRVK